MYPSYCAVHGPMGYYAPMPMPMMPTYSPHHHNNSNGNYRGSQPQSQYQYNNAGANHRSSPSANAKGRNGSNNNNSNSNGSPVYDYNDDVFGNNLGCPSAVKTSRYNMAQQSSPQVSITPQHQVAATPNASAHRTVPHGPLTNGSTSAAQAVEPHTPAAAVKPVSASPAAASSPQASASRATASSVAVSAMKALPPNSGLNTSVRVKPITGRQLERDLSLASKEELLQMLVELSTLHPAAQSFITCRAALLALQHGHGVSGKENDPVAATPLSAHNATQSGRGTVPRTGNNATTSGSSASCVAVTPLSAEAVAKRSDATPAVSVARSPAAGARVNAETRPFCVPAEGAPEGSVDHLHPCIRTYGRCRHPASCPFRNLPRNVCLAWLRKGCSCGLDCPQVHRLPGDDPALDTRQGDAVPPACPQVRLLYKLYRDEGSRRDPRVVREMYLLSMEQLAHRYDKGELEQEEAPAADDEGQGQQQQQQGEEPPMCPATEGSGPQESPAAAGTAAGSPAGTASGETSTAQQVAAGEHTPVARALDLNA